MSPMPSRSTSRSVTPPAVGLVTSASVTSRSVRNLAKDSSRVAMPFSGESADAIATMRPGTRSPAYGAKTSGWTPNGMTSMRSGSTPNSRAMSTAELCDTVTMCLSPRATLPCIRRKPYQRRRESFLRRVGAAARSSFRSMVMGWWMLATRGRPSSWSSRTPWAKVWLSWMTSKVLSASRCCATRRLPKVQGSGNPAVHMVANSRTSIRSRNSRTCGTRKGSGSR